jgi:hypothetical protein
MPFADVSFSLLSLSFKMRCSHRFNEPQNIFSDIFSDIGIATGLLREKSYKFKDHLSLEYKY